MQVGQIVKALGLEAAHAPDLARQVNGGYASDLLSCAMARAKPGNVWVTLQAHPNVIAVASLLELSAVIISEGMVPDEGTVAKARTEGINLLTTPRDTFATVALLSALGVEGSGSG